MLKFYGGQTISRERPGMDAIEQGTDRVAATQLLLSMLIEDDEGLEIVGQVPVVGRLPGDRAEPVEVDLLLPFQALDDLLSPEDPAESAGFPVAGRLVVPVGEEPVRGIHGLRQLPELQDPLEEPAIPPVPDHDGLELNLNPPAWRGISVRGSLMSGEGRLDVPNGFAAKSNGITQPVTSEIEYVDKEFEAVGIGLVSDYDLFRLSFDFYVGEWEGDARLTVDDRLVPPKVTDLEVEGDFYAFRFTGMPSQLPESVLWASACAQRPALGW